MEATYRVGGLGSGLDTNSIIDNLVKIESRSLTQATSRQQAYQSQISVLGDLTSKLSSLGDAVKALTASGVVANKVVSTTTGFKATAGSLAVAGRFQVQVGTLALAATARSTAFTADSDPVTGGTLSLSLRGTQYDIAMGDGETLATIANRINQSGAPISAAVLKGATGTFLSLSARDTGFVPGQGAASALSITETSTGSLGHPIGATVVAATNATFSVDGLDFERESNVISDAVPGTTLELIAPTAVPEALVQANDPDGTSKNLQKFVDAYNDVMKLLDKQLNIAEMTDRSKTLGGDGALRGLQKAMQSLLVTTVGTGPVTTVADLGIKSAQNGSLSLDSTKLASALSADPSAANRIFQQASTGLGAVIAQKITDYTNGVDGVLTARKSGLDRSVKLMGDRVDQLQRRLDNFKERLIARYTAMEKIVGTLKSVGSFLDQQANAKKG